MFGVYLYLLTGTIIYIVYMVLYIINDADCIQEIDMIIGIQFILSIPIWPYILYLATKDKKEKQNNDNSKED